MRGDGTRGWGMEGLGGGRDENSEGWVRTEWRTGDQKEGDGVRRTGKKDEGRMEDEN